MAFTYLLQGGNVVVFSVHLRICVTCWHDVWKIYKRIFIKFYGGVAHAAVELKSF